MEISRHLKPSLNLPSEAPAQVSSARPAQSGSTSREAIGAEALHLERLQTALSQLPDVDEDKISTLKLALARGELSLDMAALATSIYTYHSGNDA
ncbi:flagellar biosynthesis anti-sigma factor FlgM [Ectopseudomonas mendocina]|uniref:Negative regulator of flagellin synthesis n=1 Tax=Ectopseudomonas mendocina TaxID=300 RepID=A0ABZ2RKM3_ECTME